MEKTTIELFATALYENGFLQGDGDRIQEIVEIFKEIEKVRMESTWIAALDYAIELLKGLNNLESKDAFEQYYNETYGGNK